MATRILVPLDGTPHAEAALRYAETLVAATGGSMLLLRVVCGAHDVVAEISGADKYLQNIAHEMEGRGFTTELAITYGGSVGAWIAEEAQLRDIDLVVIATHGRTGLDRLFHGSTAEDLIARVSVPMLVINAAHEDGTQLERFTQRHPAVLVGLDGSEFAEAALQPARQLAANLGAQIVLVESVPEFRPRLVDAGVNTFAYVDPETFERSRSDAETYLLRMQRRLRHDGFETCSDVRVGNPAEQLLLAAHRHATAVTVLATHGRSGIKRALLGSVASQVLRETRTPLLLVPPQAQLAHVRPVPAPRTQHARQLVTT